jgi:ferredoxin
VSSERWHRQRGAAADFMIRQGLAREVSRSEMEENFAESKAKGLVMVADNVRANMRFVCHCCPCCCGLLRTINEHGYPNAVVTSSYIAEIDPKECSGCEQCVEACPVHAISVPPPVKPGEGARAAGGAVTPPPRVDEALCLGCGACALGCATGSCRCGAARRR